MKLFRRSLVCLALVACAGEDTGPSGGDTGQADTQASDAGDDGPEDAGDDADAGEDDSDSGSENPSTSISTSTSTDGGSDTGGDTEDTDSATTDPTTGDPTGTGGSDSAGGPTGLEAFCERYFECGGSYYNDVEDCMDASTNYWGTCPEALAALDAFGDCMITIPCDEYDPDAYNPANTICADEWSALGDTNC